MQELIAYLNNLLPGPVSNLGELGSLLYACWEEFAGANAEGMNSDKLNRMENVSWDPPILTFNIERHGGTVLGSTRAEIHQWDVNVEEMTAVCLTSRYRQVQPGQVPLNVKSLANNIAQLISDRKEDDRLKWRADGSVKVSIGRLIPDFGHKQTVQGRRKRFRQALEKRLEPTGWYTVSPNVYAPRKADK